eukprot:1310825-Lingulodinium_polyedra.AAC.1
MLSLPARAVGAAFAINMLACVAWLVMRCARRRSGTVVAARPWSNLPVGRRSQAARASCNSFKVVLVCGDP